MSKALIARLVLGLSMALAICGTIEAQTPAQAQRQRQIQQQLEQQQRQIEQQQRELEQRRRELDQRERELEAERRQPPTPVPRPAQPAPPPQQTVPVTVQKSAAELAAEQKERDDLAALNTRLLILAAVLASVGVFQFIAFSLQALYVWLAMRAMRRTASLAERNLTLTQRAFVFVRALDWTVSGDSVILVPAWENNGATPARSLRISTNWRSLHGDLPPDFPYNYQRPPDRVFLGPKATCDIGALTVPLRDVQAAMERRLQIYVWGRATYEDIFEGTDPHFIEFCYLVEPSAGPSGAVKLTFTHYGPYNRADGDSMRPNDPDLR
jgi:hypothetical protein